MLNKHSASTKFRRLAAPGDPPAAPRNPNGITGPVRRTRDGHAQTLPGYVPGRTRPRTETAHADLRAANARPDDPPAGISLARLRDGLEAWLLAGEVAGHSPATRAQRRDWGGKFIWWHETHGHVVCDRVSCERFLIYLRAPLGPGEYRWNNPKSVLARRELAPVSIKNFYRVLRTWMGWMVDDRRIDVSPLAQIKPPVARVDQVVPFTLDQLRALFAAAALGYYPLRDTAILAFMLDTGLRASEVVALKVRDVDLGAQSVSVLGKGNKRRQVGFTGACREHLWRYFGAFETTGPQGYQILRAPTDPLFIADDGGHLTRNGLLLLYRRLGLRAGLAEVRCSPHTMRHSFAIFAISTRRLSEFTLRVALGHTSLHTTQRYCEMARANVLGDMRGDSVLDAVNPRPARRGRPRRSST